MGADEGQWCYVDASCKSLNGGMAVESPYGARASWKYCGEKGAGDKRLRDYMPEDLSTLADEKKLDMGLLHKMAYPLRQGPKVWNEVSMFWGVGVDALKAVPAGIPSRPVSHYRGAALPFELVLRVLHFLAKSSCRRSS